MITSIFLNFIRTITICKSRGEAVSDDPEEIGKKHKRRQLPIEEKESRKWLEGYRAVAEIQQSYGGEVSIPRRGLRPARTAKLQISYSAEKLKPPTVIHKVTATKQVGKKTARRLHFMPVGSITVGNSQGFRRVLYG